MTKPYYIGVFEVTCRQYSLIMGEAQDGSPDNAVDCVAWWQIRGDPCGGGEWATIDWPRARNVHPRSFVGRLSSRTGLRFDLPTELQWEYACGAAADPVILARDVRLPCKCLDSRNGSPFPGCLDFCVGTMPPNIWGVYDMHGNVSEWCLDPFDESAVSPARAAVGDFVAERRRRVVKGGCIFDKPAHCISTAMVFESELKGTKGRGFRIIMEVPGS